jgi:hypothetical protein
MSQVGEETLGATLLAGVLFVAAIGLLLLPARFLVFGGELVIPAIVVLTVAAVIGVRHLRGLRRAAV